MRAVVVVVVVGLAFPSAGRAADPEGLEKPPKVAVTSPLVADVVVTQPYAGQIHAHRHIKVMALVTAHRSISRSRSREMPRSERAMIRSPAFVGNS